MELLELEWYLMVTIPTISFGICMVLLYRTILK